MTNQVEYPLRPYTQDWPGINTTGGKTMRVGGEMVDCTNVQINRGDTLEKRQGFVRALDERFSGVVCGLFVYADDCGNEWLLVADEDGISIRQPYQPSNLQTLDCYPNDGFDDDDPSETYWRNRDSYQTVDSELSLVASSQETNLTQGIANAMRWFKEACSNSYEVTVQFDLDPDVESRILIVVRGNNTLATGSLIAGELLYDGNTLTLRLTRRNDGLQEIELIRQEFTPSATTGLFTVSYNNTARMASATIAMTGANGTIQSEQIDVVANSAFGLVTAIGIGQTGSTTPSTAILQVIGQSV